MILPESFCSRQALHKLTRRLEKVILVHKNYSAFLLSTTHAAELLAQRLLGQARRFVDNLQKQQNPNNGIPQIDVFVAMMRHILRFV